MRWHKLGVWYRNYFGFSRTETTALKILIPGMVILLLSYSLLRESMFLNQNDLLSDQNFIDSIKLVYEIQEPLSTETQDLTSILPLENFDPNSVNRDWLVERGVPEFVSGNWVNYLKSGGSFSSPEKVKKVYGMTDSIYSVLEEYLILSDRLEFKQKQKPKNESKNKLKPLSNSMVVEILDLNLVDTTELKKVYGIGSVLSKRIVRYREVLGGFVNESQLYEVYHLDSSVVDNLLKKFKISSDFVPRKIRLNSVSEENLAKHPYLSFKEAKLVIAYREQRGTISQLDQLLEIPVITREKLERLEAYLSTDIE